MDHPNILLLMGDQHPAFMMGCYGHEVVKTPALDRLGSKGVVFDAAYCPSPDDQSSRAHDRSMGQRKPPQIGLAHLRPQLLRCGVQNHLVRQDALRGS